MMVNRKIFLIAFILISINYHCESKFIISKNFHLTFTNKNIDITKIETKTGFIEIINECDSNSTISSMKGSLYDSLLKKTSEECEKLNIISDKGYIIFELNFKGELIECKISKLSKLKEFNILLQQFATEINKKYKDKIIINCNDRISKDNYYFDIPITFQLEE